MEELIEKIKEYLDNMNNKKIISRLFIILLFAIFFLILLNSLTSKNKNNQSIVINNKDDEYNNIAEIEDYSTVLENKLIKILEKFKGVDKVHVMITLEDSLEKIPATDNTKLTETTKEVDAEGGEREVKREDERTQLINLSDDVVILKEIQPNIKGVIVVVEESEIGIELESIYEAVKTVLGVSANRIQVFNNK